MSDQTIQPPPSERRSGGAAAAYVMLAFVMAFWAGNSIIGRAVRDDIPPLALALLRWSGALLVLAPFAVGRIVAERRLILEAWRSILLLGFLGVACFNALLYSGLRHTTAANALVAPVHPRMPVVIADHQAEAWLLAQDGPALRALQPLLAPWDPAAWQLIPAAGAHASRQLSLL